jgi:hypothetical protein
MTRFTFEVHRIVAGIFLVAGLLAAGNYYLEWGYFGARAKGLLFLLMMVFIVYFYRFAPTAQDMREHGSQFRDERTFLPLLEQIVRLWPERSSLQPFLAEDFDARICRIGSVRSHGLKRSIAPTRPPRSGSTTVTARSSAPGFGCRRRANGSSRR